MCLSPSRPRMKMPQAPFSLAKRASSIALSMDKQRQHRHPAQPLRRLFPDIDQPAVIAPRHSQLDFRPARERPQKNRRIEHLDIDIELVHVFEAGFDVFHLARFSRGIVADIARLADIGAVDQPRFPARTRVVRRRHDARFVWRAPTPTYNPRYVSSLKHARPNRSPPSL